MTKSFLVQLVFNDWQRDGKSVYSTPEGVELSSGMFHSGTMIGAHIDLEDDEAEELERALKAGYSPVFALVRR